MGREIKIITIIQARISSTRLPGKVLLPVMGRPILSLMLERVRKAKLIGQIVIATSESKEDDAIEQFCMKENVACFRGSLNDLLDRHYKCGLKFKADAVSKIPSDCPLIDPNIIDRVYSEFINNYPNYDYVSNLRPASYPDGNDVEIMKFSALEKAWHESQRGFEREHTTPYIWENPEIFSLGNVKWESGLDYSMTHRWTLDYKEDYELIKSIFENLYPVNPNFGLYDILKFLEQRKDIFSINSHLAGVNWYRNHLHELKTIKPSMTKII